MKLDEFANKQFVDVLQNGVSSAGIVTEEMEKMQVFKYKVSSNSKCVMMVDPN